MRLRVATPVFGGGVEPRKFHEIEPIRAASVRGHLRFWWRATQDFAKFKSIDELFQNEQEIWGGVHFQVPPKPGRTEPEYESKPSAVAVSVEPDETSGEDPDGLPIVWPDDIGGASAYAMFSSRPAPGKNPDPLFVHQQFTLELGFPKALSDDVMTAVRAWICFGGYGSRTRRGAGTIQVLSGVAGYLSPEDVCPKFLDSKSNPAIEHPLGWVRPEGKPPKWARHIPNLRWSWMQIGSDDSTNVKDAWASAVGFVKRFRQDESRPGKPKKKHRLRRTDWPEPDKIRKLAAIPKPFTKWEHTPHTEHLGDPAWPRSSLGLPIITRFQNKDWKDQPYANPDPGFVLRRDKITGKPIGWDNREQHNFTLAWIDSAGKIQDRLASPVITKAIQVGEDQFLPVIVGFETDPPDGQVVLMDPHAAPNAEDKDRYVKGSAAPFDTISGAGDTGVRYQPLRSPAVTTAPAGQKVLTAFREWVKNNGGRRIY
ncbi:MAG: type III-B CRISPR module RAMP protein Cmr1 [Deltaproteobacteria bacterium]|nr:type III-B CRISPR module RAMP protein Cmr1 [Deltaproteobacteria bacterium]